MTLASAGPKQAVTHLVVGPADHGVVIFARWLARRTGGRCVLLPDPQSYAASLIQGSTRVHLHYTEALYGPDTTSAAQAFVRLRAALPFPVSVTLHDLPDPVDEPARYARRSAGFRAVVQAVDQVCVSSRHELGLLQGFSPDTRAQVIPLPMAADPVVAKEDWPTPRPEVAVFGFIYPGKGHEDLLAEMTGLPLELDLTAIGRIADGHAGLEQALALRAQQAGRGFSVTGFRSEEELPDRLRQVAIPVVPATRISASGSLNTWIEAGRRPLVAEGAYTRELAEAWPGAVTLYRPGHFAAAARAVLGEPSLSWLQEPPPSARREDAVARAYRDVFEDNR